MPPMRVRPWPGMPPAGVMGLMASWRGAKSPVGDPLAVRNFE
jgi:hypothetical protein